MCPPLKFRADPATFDSLESAVHGISGDSGSTEQGSGMSKVTIAWSYDRAAGIVTLQCTNKSLMVPCGAVDAKIAELAAKAGLVAA